MLYELFIIICNRIEVFEKKTNFYTKLKFSYTEGSVKRDSLSCRYDLAKLNLKCMIYSIIFTEISFSQVLRKNFLFVAYLLKLL